MKILIIPNANRNASARMLNGSYLLFFALLMIILSVVSTFAALKYLYGSKALVSQSSVTAEAEASKARIEEDNLRNELIASYQKSLTELEDIIATQDNRLTGIRALFDQSQLDHGRKVARLQSEIYRLNALGQRLIALNNLEEGEFNFAEEAALGGSNTALLEQVGSREDLNNLLSELEQEIQITGQQLVILDDILMQNEVLKSNYPSGWPMDGGWISSGFGHRIDPYTGTRTLHQGVDLVNKSGARIKAIGAGLVQRVDHVDGYGKMIEINHGNGYATLYAHLSKQLVKVGDKVLKGEAIGIIGSTGRSTGRHLHLEVRQGSKRINPINLLMASH